MIERRDVVIVIKIIKISIEEKFHFLLFLFLAIGSVLQVLLLYYIEKKERLTFSHEHSILKLIIIIIKKFLYF
jgi:hypothetical protein